MAARKLFGLAANLCSGLTGRFANITGRMNARYVASSSSLDKGAKFSANPGSKGCYQTFWDGVLGAERGFCTSAVNLFYHPKKLSELAILYKIHYAKPKIRTKRRHPLEGNPQLKGVVLKTLIKKPKKPNSANRKCVLVRLSTGKEVVAHVPGEGHNLQEHNIVLVRGGRTRDVPGLRLKVVRGKYDCAHVIKKKDT